MQEEKWGRWSRPPSTPTETLEHDSSGIPQEDKPELSVSSESRSISSFIINEAVIYNPKLPMIWVDTSHRSKFSHVTLSDVAAASDGESRESRLGVKSDQVYPMAL